MHSQNFTHHLHNPKAVAVLAFRFLMERYHLLVSSAPTHSPQVAFTLHSQSPDSNNNNTSNYPPPFSLLPNCPSFPLAFLRHTSLTLWATFFCKLPHVSLRSHQPDQRAKSEEGERGVPLPAFTPPSNPLKALTRLVLPARLCPPVYPLVATAADWRNRTS